MTIRIGTKDYVTVAERLALLHESGKSFEVLESAPFQVGTNWIWRVLIKVDERIYVGNAEVHLDSKNAAEKSDPWATAETSAIGRALAWSGYAGTPESIASADEIVRAQSPQSRQDGSQEARQSNELADKLKDLKVRAMAQGINDKAKWQSMLANLDISAIRGQAELDVIAAYLTQEEVARQGTAF